jgi:hypothetical protein
MLMGQGTPYSINTINLYRRQRPMHLPRSRQTPIHVLRAHNVVFSPDNCPTALPFPGRYGRGFPTGGWFQNVEIGGLQTAAGTSAGWAVLTTISVQRGGAFVMTAFPPAATATETCAMHPRSYRLRAKHFRESGLRLRLRLAASTIARRVWFYGRQNGVWSPQGCPRPRTMTFWKLPECFDLSMQQHGRLEFVPCASFGGAFHKSFPSPTWTSRLSKGRLRSPALPYSWCLLPAMQLHHRVVNRSAGGAVNASVPSAQSHRRLCGLGPAQPGGR